MEVGQRPAQVVPVEVGPHALGEPKFGEGALPEQEIRQTLVAAGADDQVDLGVVAARRLGDQPAEGAGSWACAAGVQRAAASSMAARAE